MKLPSGRTCWKKSSQRDFMPWSRRQRSTGCPSLRFVVCFRDKGMVGRSCRMSQPPGADVPYTSWAVQSAQVTKVTQRAPEPAEKGPVVALVPLSLVLLLILRIYHDQSFSADDSWRLTANSAMIHNLTTSFSVVDLLRPVQQTSQPESMLPLINS